MMTHPHFLAYMAAVVGISTWLGTFIGRWLEQARSERAGAALERTRAKHAAVRNRRLRARLVRKCVAVAFNAGSN